MERYSTRDSLEEIRDETTVETVQAQPSKEKHGEIYLIIT